VKSHLVAGGRHVAARLVDRGLHDGVGERQVAPRDLLLEGDEVRRAALVAIGRPLVGAAHEARDGDVEVVRRAAQHAHAVLGEALEACVSPQKVLARARDDVADVDRLARLRVGHEADLRRLVLEVEEPGDRARRAGEGRMRGDVAHALAAHPDLAVVLQPLEEFLASARRHGADRARELRTGQTRPLTSMTARPRVQVSGRNTAVETQPEETRK
jgi:hypothetical protein